MEKFLISNKIVHGVVLSSLSLLLTTSPVAANSQKIYVRQNCYAFDPRSFEYLVVLKEGYYLSNGRVQAPNNTYAIQVLAQFKNGRKLWVAISPYCISNIESRNENLLEQYGSGKPFIK
ncbi:MAG: hypothetical protein SAK29_40960 [Scytonema sp. PMC 1069.18]|nr:hypothetical protein [Scytonema sp. PMC 1069.18]MEC4884812.1 hypothetical protein [Scytonema sp. PMC 1070.18]